MSTIEPGLSQNSTQTNPDLIEIGPAIVEFGDGDDVTVFQTTIGGVNVFLETSFRELKTDQGGEMAIDERITGRRSRAEIPFAEKDLKKISEVIVGSELVTKAGKSKLVVRTGIGESMFSKAKKVVIKPVGYENDPDSWTTIPLAYPKADLKYAFDNNNERITNITLISTPDENDVILILGDEEITATP